MTEAKEPYVIDNMQRLLLPMRQILHRLITAQDNVTRTALGRDAKALDDAVIDNAFRRRDAFSAVVLHKAALRDVEEARRIARRERRRGNCFLERITELTKQNDELACDLEAARKPRRCARSLRRKITTLIAAQHMVSALLFMAQEGRDVRAKIDQRLAQRDRIVESIVAQYTGDSDG